MTSTPADTAYGTARTIAAGLPGAHARNMPALCFATVKWFPQGGGEVTVWVKHHGGIDVEMRGITDTAITAAVQAIAAVQAQARETVPA